MIAWLEGFLLTLYLLECAVGFSPTAGQTSSLIIRAQCTDHALFLTGILGTFNYHSANSLPKKFIGLAHRRPVDSCCPFFNVASNDTATMPVGSVELPCIKLDWALSEGCLPGMRPLASALKLAGQVRASGPTIIYACGVVKEDMILGQEHAGLTLSGHGCRGQPGQFTGHIRFQNAPGVTVDNFGGRATLETGSAGGTMHAWAGSTVVVELNGTGSDLAVHAGNAMLRVLLHSSGDRGASSRVFVQQALGLTVTGFSLVSAGTRVRQKRRTAHMSDVMWSTRCS